MAIARVTLTTPLPPAKPVKAKPKVKPKVKRRMRVSVRHDPTALPDRAADLPDSALGFTSLLDRGAKVLAELRQLEGRRKLSASAFLRTSQALSGRSDEQLDALQQVIATSPAAHLVSAFIARLAKQIREPTWSCIPAAKLHRLVGCYGREGVEAQMGIVGCSVADALALAVREAVRKFPGSFGTIDDFDEHQRMTGELRQRLTLIYGLMERVYTPADTMLEGRSLTPTERGRGLLVVRLRRYPSIILANDDWAARAVELHLAAATRSAPPPEREPEAEVPLPENTKQRILDIARTLAIVAPMQSSFDR